MLKKKYILNVILTSIIILAVGCSANDDSSASEGSTGNGITLSFAHELPNDHPWGMGAEKFKEVVEGRTDGEIKIEIHGNGSLAGTGAEVQEGVQIGTIDIGISSTPLAQINPYVQIFNLPYIFSDRENAWEVLDGPIGSQVGEYVEEHNIKHLSYWEDGFRQVTNSQRPITTPEDFDGLTIRVPESEIRIETFKALGASPLSMSFSEVFTGLQQGAIDGQENPLSVVESSSFYDVQEYLSITNHVYTPAGLLINKDKWDSLTEEQQEVILEAAEAGRDVNRELNKENDESLITSLEEYGMEVNEIEDLSSFQGATKGVWDLLTQDLGEDAQEIIDQILETQEIGD
jgi:tripartite ATP-independent transporter DctP family solute receptor